MDKDRNKVNLKDFDSSSEMSKLLISHCQSNQILLKYLSDVQIRSLSSLLCVGEVGGAMPAHSTIHVRLNQQQLKPWSQF